MLLPYHPWCDSLKIRLSAFVLTRQRGECIKGTFRSPTVDVPFWTFSAR